MGQIFNRIKNITKSYINDTEDLNYANKIIDSDQDNLKRIIDELNIKEKSKSSSNNTNPNNGNHRNTNTNTSNQTSSFTLNDAYRILEINSNSDIDSIKTAYKTKIKEYHPDKVQTMGKEIQEIANRKTKEINDAYNLIKKHRNF